MKNRNILSTLFVVLACGVFVSSCNDDFSEGDLLDHQRDQAEKIAAEQAAKEAAEKAEEEAAAAANAAALAAAGVALDYTVTAHSDDVPVAGATITLTNASDGSTNTATTDANGNAAFVDIALGGHVVAINSDDHLNISYIVDFGRATENVHFERVNDNIVPIETSEASKVELMSLTGTQTATIKGNVEIETDLTNNLPEVPQNITVRANFDDSFNASHSTVEDSSFSNETSIYVLGSFSFTEGDIGVATVDNATGAYSMVVPATEEGTDIDLLLPLVEADQTMAWTMENGEDVGFNLGVQPALFGTDIVATGTPDVNGAQAVFPEPPPAGRGFAMNNFQPMYRGVLEGEFDSSIDDFPLEDDFNYLRFRGNPGSDDFQLTPVITVSESDNPIQAGDTALIEAWMDWEFDTYEITSEGEYASQSNVDVILDITDDNGNVTPIPITTMVTSFTGRLTPGEYNFNLGVLFTPYVVTAFNIRLEPQGGVTTPATVGSVKYSGEIRQFEILNSGDGYNSIPTITVGPEGSPSTPASLEITDMAFQYQFDLDNSGVTSGYVVRPNIGYEYNSTPGTIETASAIDVFQLDDDGQVVTSPAPEGFFALELILRVDNGNLVFDDDNALGTTDIEGARTSVYSYTTPKGLVVEPEHEQATGIAVLDNGTGEVTGLAVTNTGSGYTEQFDVSIESLLPSSGSGALFELSGFTTDPATGEVSWNGTAIKLADGSGYTSSVNIGQEGFSGATSVSVRNGETKVINFNYGTGDRVNDID
ncbi:carboxypeptidase-like regulatory domain-containing protein [Flagellimonas sp. S3867]|uniref:carboxypeptidase-like regulatory domain-containing protein n=1 Tax=Flagellimonas sp. S3867 TaxID=2768063 RepID=UPI0016826DD8|nr:carboxypeptidase-like regulatory domain-containing protein [Flagellimonas sp. S3867]